MGMQFRDNDLLEIKQLLKQESGAGEQYVVFPNQEDQVFGSELAFFSELSDALENAYESTTDRDVYCVRTITEVEAIVNNQLSEKAEKVKRIQAASVNKHQQKKRTIRIAKRS